mgnify:CR=1 FL=1
MKKGEQVTLSGRTGAGKSTILKLLLGLYEPQSGSIRIGNVSATEVPEEERRSLFGYVEQSFHMVPGTVREQITLYDRRITEKQVQAAARLTGLEDSIASLENGYDTVVGGAGGEYVGAAADCGADAFVTGEVRHHEAVEARMRGLALYEAGHYHTEVVYRQMLCAALAERCPGVRFRVSKSERPPMEFL